ncbi:MAG: bifunctional diaminohydroxyphosphoribosylaminopyrimidine deaminase/5-amino-6-(5-phosphoribosylamino)uracil reductase [Alphaproteobacteria bacterium]
MKKNNTQISLSSLSPQDENYLSLCLSLSKRHIGLCGKNPSVAAVLATPEKIIDIAITAIGGRPHAEEILLAKQPFIPLDSTLYLSLEPCAHHSPYRTKSCADNIVSNGIKRLVVACHDPNPKTNGAGFDIIKKSGATILLGNEDWQKKAEKIYQGFFSRIKQQKPWVAIKIALSADNKTILPKNFKTSHAHHQKKHHQITNGQLQFFSQYIRCIYDGLLVSAKTIFTDDPLLTIRERGLPILEKTRFIIDHQNLLQGKEKIFTTTKMQPLFIFCAKKNTTLPADAIQIILPTNDKNHFSWKDIFLEIAKYGINCLLIETGGKLLLPLKQQNYLDELWLCQQTNLVLGDTATCPIHIHDAIADMEENTYFAFDNQMGIAKKYGRYN